jgi:hypothetical protein
LIQEKTMKTLLFDKFSAMGAGNDKAIREITRRFAAAGAQVVSSEVAKTLTKRAGIAFRNIDFTFADGQTVTMSVKETGDVFEVRINKSVQPLRQQDDHGKAIAEIGLLLDKKRVAFQRALARVRTPLPPSLRVSRTTLLQAKVEKRDGLKEAIALAEVELAEITGESAAA